MAKARSHAPRQLLRLDNSVNAKVNSHRTSHSYAAPVVYFEGSRFAGFDSQTKQDLRSVV